jgi:GntR family transcriptional regulator/MocR family aminotransferase
MDLLIDLDAVSGPSRRARLELALRDAIREGRLAPGTRLPPTRQLCDELGVSRGVVVEAYAQLAAEGYLQTRRGAGTTVAAVAAPSRRPAPTGGTGPPVRYDLSPFDPALAQFPRTMLAGALTETIRHMPDAALGLPDPAGAPELRAALAGYLGRSRGVRAQPQQVLITAGTRHGFGLVWAALAQRGARAVAIESPGWAGARETVRAAGLATGRLDVAADGLDVGALTHAAIPGAADDAAADPVAVDAVAVAPAHQYPTGAVLSAPRRQALVGWAQTHGRLIAEDDYDAEYRYDRQPIGCLQGLAPEHVVYAGTTSKTLSPALRLGWLVLPTALVAPVTEIARTRGGAGSPLLQLALARLIERGDLDRHLRRERRRCQRRRQALLQALDQRLPDLRVTGASAGLFAVLELPDGVDEADAVRAAARRGIRCERRGTDPGALVLGYANLAPEAARPAVTALAAAIASCG